MNIKQKREYGDVVGREGLSERVIFILEEYGATDISYKEAIIICGRLKALAEAATFDTYWNEKMMLGYEGEELNMELTIKNP